MSLPSREPDAYADSRVRPASLNRYALREYTFQDGTVIPKGAFVTASLHSVHMDENNFENATMFKPWRFSEMREVEGESTKHQFTNATYDYLSFGFGKHAWYVFLPSSVCSPNGINAHILVWSSCVAPEDSSPPTNSRPCCVTSSRTTTSSFRTGLPSVPPISTTGYGRFQILRRK